VFILTSIFTKRYNCSCGRYNTCNHLSCGDKRSFRLKEVL